mgnify:FL=1
MYERSAIVLEKYLNKIFGPDKESDIRVSYETFKNVLEEMEKYQVITEEEEKIIDEFDDIVNKMQKIQKEQEGLSKEITKHEDIRTKLFNDFDQEPAIIEKKLIKIENIIDERAQKEQELRESYIELLNEFTEKQTERNKCNKMKRTSETNHIKILNGAVETLGIVDVANVKKIKEFITTDDELLCESLNKIMLENGKNEKVKFDRDVMKKAVEVRIKMAKKEAECYVTSYERLKRLMAEIDNDNLNLSRYQKNLKDITAKLKFLEIEKEYLVSFLDNERITAISGEKAHKTMMEQACKDFDGDMVQIHNLYNLLTREITGKSTKKAYKELYNSTYLLGIEEKEKSFNQEVNNIKSKAGMGTIINTNYWRIDGIKNIYEIFNQEVEENYGRDLSEFMPEEKAEEIEENVEEPELLENDQNEIDEEEWFISNKDIGKEKAEKESDDEYNYDDEEYSDDDEYEEDNNNEYETDDYEDDYDENNDEEDDYEEDDYDDEYDDEYGDEYDDEYNEYDEDEEELDAEETKDNEEDEKKEREEIRKYIKGKTKRTSKIKNKKDEKESIFEKFFSKGKV